MSSKERLKNLITCMRSKPSPILGLQYILCSIKAFLKNFRSKMVASRNFRLF